MDPIEDKDIRASFVNCSQGEAKRISLPRGLSELPWADLDFLGWRDPGAPDRGYLVVRRDDRLTGVTLRAPQKIPRGFTRTTACSLCLTTHPGSGVALLAAPRAGAAGRQGNTVGAYMCADLGCSLYLRDKRDTGLRVRYEETLTLEQRIDRMLGNLDGFLRKVTA
ncbi:FBP domain-containing protein [Streptomyces sp. NPDC002004]